ncbi:Very-long-chain (3R)-3-hydroxyacyl-CoA dehydratase PASTICCINO 2, partial [Datura stramonium]|nr:Very-long-chain (3R)-3-hydroxyacyl-CoA dehydratase PASTICCINO 2 [Datura stramonium]
AKNFTNDSSILRRRFWRPALFFWFEEFLQRAELHSIEAARMRRKPKSSKAYVSHFLQLGCPFRMALKESGHEHVYDAVEKPLLFAQTAAFLEILHSLLGLVRSPVSATLPQISSRLYVTWGIVRSFPEVQTHILVSSLVISWSITEIIRYSFFGTREAFGSAPSWLLWLRYSTFLVLYPTGITSEVGLIYNALPYMKEYGKYAVRMPNKWNFSFDYYYAALVCLAIYVPGCPHLYSYMLGQRKKALSKTKKA